MPIYEYACNGCGHEFEEWQKITDAPVSKCPSCGERKVERLVSLSSFHLKGSGWYVTDYGGKKSGSESASKDSKDKEKGSGKDTGKDSKGSSGDSKDSGGSARKD
jgi:putative FmdB family regulatory protein